jgi:hypothetical protein
MRRFTVCRQFAIAIASIAVLSFGACSTTPGELAPDPCEAAPVAAVMDWSSFRVGNIPRDVPVDSLQIATTPCEQHIRVEEPKDDEAPDELPNEPAYPPNIAWLATANGPVTSTPAVYLANWPSSSASDFMVFGTSPDATNPAVFKLTDLYNPSGPTSTLLGSTAGLDGSSVTIHQGSGKQGLTAYALDAAGNLRCYVTQAGGSCSGFPYAGGAPVSKTSPWLDHNSGNIYYIDLSGTLRKVATATGSLQWSVNLRGSLPGWTCTSCGSKASPIVINNGANNVIYVGFDGGAAFRVVDPGGTTAPSGANIQSLSLCGGATIAEHGCNSSAADTTWDFFNSMAADILAGEAYAAVAGRAFALPLDVASPWAVLYSTNLLTAVGFPAHNAPTLSSPAIDLQNDYLYVHHTLAEPNPIASPGSGPSEPPPGSNLFKVSINALGNSFPAVYRTTMAAKGNYTDQAATPLVWDPTLWGQAGTTSVFVGNGAGEIEQYACLSSATAPNRVGLTASFGAGIESAPVIDFNSGNVNIGFDAADGTGGVLQLLQSGPGTCTREAAGAGSCGGSATCSMCSGQTMFRVTTMATNDPHFYVVQSGTCQDITDEVCVSLFGTCNLAHECGVNMKMKAAIQGDAVGSSWSQCSNPTALASQGTDPARPADGYLDLNSVTLFKNFSSADGATYPVQIASASGCSAPLTSKKCFAPLTATATSTITNSTATSGNLDPIAPHVCLGKIPNTYGPGNNNSTSTNPYGNTNGKAITVPAKPCGTSGIIETLVLDFGALKIIMHDAMVSSQVTGTAPNRQLTNGLIRGFMTQAEAALVDVSSFNLGVSTLAQMLPDGSGCPNNRDDRDTYDWDGNGAVPGWWFYVNFTADEITCDPEYP